MLFNNAGTAAPAVPFDELSTEAWNAVVAVNLTGAFLCARAAFGAMRRQSPQGGRIINNGSISSQVPRLRSAPYTATKHAITGLTKSLALDGREYNIACGQIDIGNAATEMTRQMARGVLQADGSTAIEPTMDVALVADAVVQMARLPLDANVLFDDDHGNQDAVRRPRLGSRCNGSPQRRARGPRRRGTVRAAERALAAAVRVLTLLPVVVPADLVASGACRRSGRGAAHRRRPYIMSGGQPGSGNR